MSKEGWVCPLCGAANAPWMPKCDCVKKPAEQQPVQTAPFIVPVYVPMPYPQPTYPQPVKYWWQDQVTCGSGHVTTTTDKIVWGQQ